MLHPYLLKAAMEMGSVSRAVVGKIDPGTLRARVIRHQLVKTAELCAIDYIGR
jgi:hypothetical protein